MIYPQQAHKHDKEPSWHDWRHPVQCVISFDFQQSIFFLQFPNPTPQPIIFSRQLLNTTCKLSRNNVNKQYQEYTIYIHANIEGRLGLSAIVPESQKLKMVDKACMALNIQMWQNWASKG